MGRADAVLLQVCSGEERQVRHVDNAHIGQGLIVLVANLERRDKLLQLCAGRQRCQLLCQKKNYINFI